MLQDIQTVVERVHSGEAWQDIAQPPGLHSKYALDHSNLQLTIHVTQAKSTAICSLLPNSIYISSIHNVDLASWGAGKLITREPR